SDEQPVLLDFGAAKVEFSKHSKSRHALTPGYAAPEQITDIGKLGPWTDIYAIGAVMWRMVTGENPVKSEARGHTLFRGGEDPVALEGRAGASRFSQGFLQLVSDCLNYDETQRPQSAEQLLTQLDAVARGEASPVSPGREQAADPAPEKSPDIAPVEGLRSGKRDPVKGHSVPASPGRKIGLGVAGLVVAAGIGGVLWTMMPTEHPSDSAESGAAEVETVDQRQPSDASLVEVEEDASASAETQPSTEAGAETDFRRAVQAWYFDHDRDSTVIDRLEKAAAAGHVLAQVELARHYWYGKVDYIDTSQVEGDREKARALVANAFSELMQLGEEGDPHAQYLLGEIHYFEDWGPSTDREQAMEWFRRGAEQQYPPSMLEYGYLLLNGGSSEDDREAGRDWLRQAAEMGMADAQYRFGETLLSDRKTRHEWRTRAAELGHRGAQRQLAFSYHAGAGPSLERDFEKASFWFEKLARAGDSGARGMLLGIYESGGNGLEPDFASAWEWLQEHEGPYRDYRMGYYLEHGLGVERDLEAAKSWYRKAAEEDFPSAIARLGYLERFPIASFEPYQFQPSGTVVDTHSGLEWARCLAPARWQGLDCDADYWQLRVGSSNFDHQLDELLKETALGGFDDWRVPTSAELRGVIFCSNESGARPGPAGCREHGDDFLSPALNSAVFPLKQRNRGAPASSTLLFRDGDEIGGVDINTGETIINPTRGVILTVR
ncbi:DUF1566 domain-containing protein, partial [Thioalkalivibrio sp. ALJ8]